MRGLRSLVLQTLPKFPVSLNRALMALNRDPRTTLGPRYARYRQFLREQEESYDPAPELLRSVNEALLTVPYYRGRYGTKPVTTIAEFEHRMGTIDRETIAASLDAFIANGIDRSRYDWCTTGGTSGQPLQLLAPRDRYVIEMATMHSLWERAGFAFHVRGVIRNQCLRPDESFRVNPLTREVIFDGFRLEREYFRKIYDTLASHRIRFVHSYPSIAYEFATFLVEENLDPSILTAFLSGSENIFDYQRDLIENRLGIRFFNWYGHTEKLVLGGYCGHTTDYHIEPTYGYFELLDEAGGVIRTPGRIGEITGTGLRNPAMPLIRYRTGDFAEYVGDHCSACGRHVPLIRNVRGRWSGDRVYHANGSFVTTTALNLHDDLYSVIHGIQYLQERKGELTVLIVKSPRYIGDHETALYRHFRSKLHADTTITVRYVDRLLRKANGKFVHIMSTVDVPSDSQVPVAEEAERVIADTFS